MCKRSFWIMFQQQNMRFNSIFLLDTFAWNLLLERRWKFMADTAPLLSTYLIYWWAREDTAQQFEWIISVNCLWFALVWAAGVFEAAEKSLKKNLHGEFFNWYSQKNSLFHLNFNCKYWKFHNGGVNCQRIHFIA